jgi:ubiquinone/menaquinone biosynthesis C-methylase UbiE
MEGSLTNQYDDWANLYDLIHSNHTADVPFYVQLAKERGGSILEAACGTGRVTIPIGEAGIDILGFDNSVQMLQSARRNLSRAGIATGRVSFEEADMRDFQLGKTFNLALVPFNSFLVLLSIAEQRQALECIRRHLSPGGTLALDIFVPDVHRLAQEDAYLRHKEYVTDPESGRRFAIWEQSTYDNHNQIIQGHLILEEISPDGKVTEKFYRDMEIRYVYRYEMQHLLEASGFEVEDLFGNFEGDDYNEDSTTMVWLAKKA